MHRGPRGPAVTSDLVLGQAPTRVERVPEATDRTTRKQRLVPHLRADRIHRLRRGEQIPRVDPVRQKRLTVPEIGGREVPTLAPSGDLGMGLDHQPGARILRARRVQHPRKGLRPCPCPGDRRIARGLVDHQDAWRKVGPSCHRRCVLAEPTFSQNLGHARRLNRIVIHTVLQHRFEARGAAPVEIDAHIVDDQRDRQSGPCADGVQQAVLDGDQLCTRARRDPSTAGRYGLLPPDTDRSVTPGPARRDRQPGQRQHAPDPLLAKEAEGVGVQRTGRPRHGARLAHLGRLGVRSRPATAWHRQCSPAA